MEGNLMHHGDGYGYHPLFVLEEDFSAGNDDVCNRASIEPSSIRLAILFLL
jgi:hypothetical protein